MICNLHEHRNMQPNHPDPVGPPLDYMGECQLFDGIQSDIYDLCRFYTLGVTGDLPEFPTSQGTGYPWPGQGPVKISPLHQPTLPDPGTQHRFGNGCLYVEGIAHGHLFTMLTSGPLVQACKTIVLPLLHIRKGNNLSYLNHIIIAHYNASYGCGKCLKQAFMSSSALHNHKKVCLRFIAKKPAAGSDSKPSSGRGGDGSHGSSTRATPKEKDFKAPATDSQGSSTPPALQTAASHSECETSHHHKSHKDLKKDLSGDEKKKKKDASPARKSSRHKTHKDGGHC